jgi:hypothetical protein
MLALDGPGNIPPVSIIGTRFPNVSRQVIENEGEIKRNGFLGEGSKSLIPPGYSDAGRRRRTSAS